HHRQMMDRSRDWRLHFKTHRSHHRQMVDRSRDWRVHFHRLAAVATPGGGHHLSRVRDAVVVREGLRGCHASRELLSA
ncbi:MAG: hypothetical protein ACKN81_12390, partial [Pirellulaceae bacterium]